MGNKNILKSSKLKIKLETYTRILKTFNDNTVFAKAGKFLHGFPTQNLKTNNIHILHNFFMQYIAIHNSC